MIFIKLCFCLQMPSKTNDKTNSFTTLFAMLLNQRKNGSKNVEIRNISDSFQNEFPNKFIETGSIIEYLICTLLKFSYGIWPHIYKQAYMAPCAVFEFIPVVLPCCVLRGFMSVQMIEKRHRKRLSYTLNAVFEK